MRETMKLTSSEQQIVEAAHDWFESHRDEFVKDLISWVSIPSVSDESLAAPGAPFGPDVARMFALAAERAAELGLTAVQHDGYAMSVLLGDQDSDIGLISHLDVVPAGKGWIHEPYAPFEK